MPICHCAMCQKNPLTSPLLLTLGEALGHDPMLMLLAPSGEISGEIARENVAIIWNVSPEGALSVSCLWRGARVASLAFGNGPVSGVETFRGAPRELRDAWASLRDVLLLTADHVLAERRESLK